MKSLVVAMILVGSVGICVGQRNPTALEKKSDRSSVFDANKRESNGSVDVATQAEAPAIRVEIEKVEPPQILTQPRASRPPNSGTICLQGSVLLKVELLYDGTVGKIIVVRGLPHGFTEQAVVAAARISFIPGSKGGVPTTKVKTFEYRFGMHY